MSGQGLAIYRLVYCRTRQGSERGSMVIDKDMSVQQENVTDLNRGAWGMPVVYVPVQCALVYPLTPTPLLVLKVWPPRYKLKMPFAVAIRYCTEICKIKLHVTFCNTLLLQGI